jgi:hypothetical protein
LLRQQRPLHPPPDEPRPDEPRPDEPRPDEMLPADLPPPLPPPPRNASPDPLPLEEGALKDRSVLGEDPRKPISLRLPEFPGALNPLPRPSEDPNERRDPRLPELSKLRSDPLPELIDSVPIRPLSIPRSVRVIPAAPALPLPEELPLLSLMVGAILSLDPPGPLDVLLFPDLPKADLPEPELLTPDLSRLRSRIELAPLRDSRTLRSRPRSIPPPLRKDLPDVLEM